MEALKIKGGVPLKGEVRASGAKNAVTKLLVASLLSDKTCLFRNVPNIGEVEAVVDLCCEIGSEIVWDKEERTIEIQTKELSTSYIPQRFSGSNRIPILMIGALLGRTDHEIIVPTVGGCVIGKRPVDFHISALEKLGATIEYRNMRKDGAYIASAHDGLKGTVIELEYPSVGATENTILASVCARGTTVIKNAAVEPEVVDLILFLQKLGAIISIDTDRTIHIQGTRHFYEVDHTVISDRAEIASLGMAAVCTKGRIFIEGAEHQSLMAFLNKLREVGGGFTVHPSGIEFFYDGPLQGGIHLETDVHPGFLTDWQQPYTVMLTQATGASVVHETVYENRLGYTETLMEMGADISLFRQCLGSKSCRFHEKSFHHSAVIKGPTPLTAKDVAIPDLRAGFAYVMAALIAEGTTLLTNIQYLDRGYEQLDLKLASLGAQIERVEVDEKKEPSPLLDLQTV